MARNKRGNLKFASLQGNSASRLLPPEMVRDLSSIVYYRNDKCFTKSTAILLICMDMAWYGFVAAVFFVVPRFLRDWVYDRVAGNRYKWFGRRETCRIPTAQERSRFVE